MVDHCGFVCALYVRNMKAQKNQVLGPGCMLYWSRTMGECTTIYDLWQWIWYLKQEHCSTVVYCLHIWLLPTAFPPLQCQTMRWYLKHTNGQVDLLHYCASILFHYGSAWNGLKKLFIMETSSHPSGVNCERCSRGSIFHCDAFRM